MINKNRYLLVTSSRRRLEKALRYESITEVTSANQVPEVWRFNRTPVIMKEAIEKDGEIPALMIPNPANVTGEGTAGNQLIEIPVLGIPDEVLDNPDVKAFEKFSHSKGFESGEFMTGEIYDTKDDDCFLCKIANLEGSNKPLWIYNKSVAKEENVIIMETPHFFVVPEKGSMRIGYLMICPKEHILSVAELPDGYFAEYFQIERDIEYVLKSTYGFDQPVSFFEHGSDPNGKSSHKRSVVHAHTHLCWGFELSQYYLDMVQMRPCKDIREARGGKYFSYRRNADGEILIVNDPRVYVQRQYPRQVMAEELRLAPDQYDWRKDGFEENVTATLYRIYRFLFENWEALPDRIKLETEGFVRGYPLRDH